MKKLITIILASVLSLTAVSAYADTVSEEGEQQEFIQELAEPEAAPAQPQDSNKVIYALDSPKAYAKGEIVDTEIPYMYDGVTMMPVETLIPLLGGEVVYNDKARTLTLWLNGWHTSFGIDDVDCRLFDTAFYPIRPICEALAINLEWYDGLLSFSLESAALDENAVSSYKSQLNFAGFSDVMFRDKPVPQWFVNPYVPYTYSQMNKDLHMLRQMYPDLFSKVYSIGKSSEGRDISAINFGKGDTKVIVCGSMHAREYIASTYIMYYLDRYAYSYHINEVLDGKYNVRDILNNVTFVVVPQINPDGINLVQNGVESTRNPDAVKGIQITSDGGKYGYRGWKSNTNGVNLNANFPILWKPNGSTPNSSSYGGPEGGSEAETKAMVNLMNNTDFEILASFHTQGEVIYWMDANCDRDLVAKHKPYVDRICKETGYMRMPADDTVGVGRCMTDYARYYKRAMAMTIELCPYVGDYPYPDNNFDRVAWPVRNLGMMLGNIALELAGKR